MIARLAVASLACVLSGACVGDTDFSNTSFRCSDGVTCPEGYSCQENVCVDPAGQAPAPPEPTPDPGADSAPPADDLPDSAEPPPPPPEPAACATIAMLTDDFDDGDLDDPRWGYSFANPGTSRQEIDGALVLAIEPDAGNAFVGSMTPDTYDVRGESVRVEVVQVGGRFTTLELRDTLDAYVQLRVDDGELQARLRSAGDEATTLARVDYDPVAHRWWQIREQGGVLHWETSADGQAWSELHAAEGGVDAANVRLVLSAGASVGAPSEARFDNLQPDGDSNIPWCAASDLLDDFDDGLRARAWGRAYTSSGCTLTEADGGLSVVASGEPNSWCGYTTGKRYDLRGSSVAVEVLGALAGDTASTFLKLVPYDTSKAVQFVVEDASLVISTRDGDWIALARVEFDPVAHRWWRLREQDGAVLWETSPDALAWTLVAQVPAFLDLSAVTVEIGAGTWSTSTPPQAGEARFDNLNVAP